MRLRVEHLSLVGTTREAEFQPGLNIILGPITTGKSTLIKLLRVLLGSGIPSMPPEVREHVSAVAGQLRLADERASVVRPVTTTPTARVDVATESGAALRLPALQASAGAPMTYGRWLLQTLGLPDLRVAAAPTRPAESAATAVSINDFLGYCRLSQEEIDTSVFGSDHPQRNIKRQYVFRILYGLFDAHLAGLQEELRRLESELRLVQAGAASFRRFLEGTAWENRAALEQQRDAARTRRRDLDDEEQVAAVQARRLPRAQELRGRLQELDETLAEARARRENEQRSVAQLEELAAQLETQSNRLTKSIVAGSRLYDIDFRVCPRCASPVQAGREDPGHCYLCLQVPQAQLSREDLVHEQERLFAQLEETATLIAARQDTVAELERRLAELEIDRARVGRELDEQTQAFVSDQAEEIAHRTAERSGVDATIQRCEDYLRLYARLDAAQAQEGELRQRKEQLDAAIAQAEVVEADSAARIERLEERFAEMVDAFGTPRFEGEPRAAIDRRTYLPILNGRTFEQLSSGGLKVLANLAYALAHHLTALDLDLPLPGLLMIDGITKNVGRDEYDRARVEAVFDSLRQIGTEYGDRLQLIVAANDVPEAAADRVVLRLSEEDRLIPVGAA